MEEKNKNIKNQKIFIEPLEQRIMLDGAGASTFLDLIDERNQQEIKKNSKNKDIYKEGTQTNTEIPFTTVAREARNDRKNIVFIDSQVKDYREITKSFRENTEVYLINSNEDGFKRIDEVLKDRENINALHLIGHGSAGQILFGNAFLNNDTIDNYKSTLSSIGQSLTDTGDILFYGCNVASTDQGQLLIKKISEITKADIAASDDLTGKGGDWELEKQFGLIGEEELKVKNYNHALGSLSTTGVLSGSGVTHIDSNVTMMNSGNVGLGASGAYATVGSDFGLAVEELNVSVSSGDLISNIDVDTNYIWNDDNNSANAELQNGANQNASSNITVNSYLMFLVDNLNKRTSTSAGEVVFDGEIVGIFFDQAKTRAENVDGNTYHSSSLIYAMNGSGGVSNSVDSDGGRMPEGKKPSSGMTNFFNSTQSHGSGGIADSSNGSDWVSVSNHGSGTNNLLQFGAQNANSSAGDYIRILVIPNATNTAPTASNSTEYINENNQVSSAGDRTPSNITKIFAASDFNFSDSDSGDSLSKVKITTLESAGALEHYNGSSWVDVTLNQEISASDIGNDYLRFTPAANSESNPTFGFKVHDGTEYSSSAYTMTISVNAAPNVTDTTVGSTVSAGGTSSGDVHDGVADSDDADSVLVVTGVASGNESSNNSIVTNNTGVGSAVSGTYGSLNIAANGTYTYTASATNNISHGSTATDTFTFTTRDDETNSGSFAYDVGTITFTVASSNNAPVAADNIGTVKEDATLTVSNGATSNSITGASFVDSFDLSSQESNPQGVAFNEDGTKMFIVGRDGDEVNEYTLSTGYDVSTASYDSNFSVASQDTIPQDIVFNADGTKMFILGEGNGAVYAYNLSTGFDVSTASFINNFSVASQENSPQGLAFNNDGTKMFITGGGGRDVNEYTLASAFNTATASFVDSFDISSQDTLPNGLVFNSDGTKMFVTGNQGNDINEYTLSTGFDVSSASFVGNISVSSQDTTPGGIKFNNDGTKLFMVGVAGADINEYTLTTPFSLVNISGEHDGDVLLDDTDADSDTLTVTQIAVTGESNSSVSSSSSYNSSGTSKTGTYGTLRIGADGSYDYVADQAAADVLDPGAVVTDSFTYTVSDGNGGTDTATLIITVVGVNDDPVGVVDSGFIKEGGTLTVANSASANAGSSTGNHTGDITDNDTDADPSSTATITHIQHSGAGSATAVNNVTYNHGSATSVSGTYGTLTIGSDGSYSYVANSNISGLDAGDANLTDVFTYTVSDGTASTTTTLTINVIASQDLTARNDTGTVNEDATLTVDNGDNATSVTAATHDSSPFSVASQETGPRGLAFSSDGKKFFIAGYQGKDVNEYHMTAAFDVSTASFDSSFSVSNQEIYTHALAFNTDGTKMFVAGYHGDDVNEYTLSTAWDVSTASFVDSFDISAQNLGVRGLAFSNDGTKMFTTNNYDNTIEEYTLTTGFDVSTASHTDTMDISSYDLGIRGITFNNDGTRMFFHGQSGHDINEFTLSTAYDISTSTFVGTTTPPSVDGGAEDIAFNNDGTKLFISGNNDNTIDEYSLTSPFSLYNVSGENTGDVLDTSSTDNYDTDPDSDTLTVTAIRTGSSENNGTPGSVGSALDGTYGQLTIAANGSYTYVANKDAADALDPGDVVTDSFNYTVSDGQGETDIAVLTITVIGINDDPAGVADTDSVATSNTVTDATNSAGTVISDDTDVDASSSLTVTAIQHSGAGGATSVSAGTTRANGASSIGTYGTLTIGADGSYSYVAGSSTGTDVFTYTVSDGTETTTTTLTITVGASNNAPSAVADTDSVNEDATVTQSSGSSLLTADDTDGDGDSLTVTQIKKDGGTNSAVSGGSSYNSSGTSVTGTYGTLTVGADGTYTYVADQAAADALDASDIVTDVFTYTISDGNGGTDTANLTITVTGVNDAPVAQNDTGSVNEDGTLTVSNSSNATSVTGVSQDTGSPYSLSAGTARSVAFNHDGTKMFVVHAPGTATISEHALTTAFDINTASQSTTYDISSHISEPRGIRFNSDGTKLYIISSAGGNKKIHEYSLSTAYDVSSLPTPSSTVISSQDGGPRGFTFNTDGTKMFLLGDTNHHVYEYSLSTAFDTTTISYTSRSLDFSSREVTPRGISFNPTGSKLFITGQSSDEILEYDLSTGFNLSTATFNGAFDVSSFANKPNDIVFNNDGSKAFLARANSNAVLSFSLSSPYSFVDITGEHTGDVIDTSSSSNSDSDADASSSLTISAIRAGSSEGNGNPGSVGSALDGTYGQLTINANGSYSYVANKDAADALDPGDIVTDSFNYTVSDGTATDIGVITITVVGVNDAPTASNNTITTNEDTNHIFSTSEFNFSDADDSGSLNKIKITSLEDNGALQYFNGSSWVDVTLNQEITALDISNGYLRFKPDSNENGSSYTSFGFQVNDGTAYSSSNTMTVNVTAVNDTPTATDDTASVTDGSSVTVSNASSGVIDDNDTDPDSSDTLVITNISHTNGNSSNVTSATTYSNGTSIVGTYGTLTIGADGTYTYTPNGSLDTGESGNDVFTYTVSDGSATDTATITISVTGANDAPVASNDSNTIDISTNSTLTVTDSSIKDVLTNDTDADTNDTISVTEIRTGALEGAGTSGVVGSSLTGTYGTLTINSNGSYTYIVNTGLEDTLDKGQIVFEYFNYTVSDGTTTDTGSIVIKLQNGGQVVKEIREKKAERLIKRESKRNEKSNKSNFNLPKIESNFELNLNQIDLPKQNKKVDFSQGLKLTDLVAETNSIEVKEKLKDVPDVFADKVKVKVKNDSLNLKFKIFNESGSDIIKYEGVMKDGSPLPDWIKVDPKTGATKTNIPDGVENVEIIIIATDSQNERREISVKIDPEKILKDKQILKRAKKQNANITVDESGNVNLVKNNQDGSVDQNSTSILNFNNKSDILDILQSKRSDTLYNLKPKVIDTNLVINLPSELSQKFERSKLVLKDGSEIPEWLSYDPNSGKIIAEPPEDISKLDLKLIIERDGEIIVKDLSIEFGDDDTARIDELNNEKIDNKFVSLKDQLDKEFTSWDDYGSNVINRL